VRQHLGLVQILDAKMQLLNKLLLLHDNVLAAHVRNSEAHDQVCVNEDESHLYVNVQNSGLARSFNKR